ncbi:MAG: PQQ-dependent sugar dehydrogenase, partial [Acidimicrobiia bacterium]
MKPLGFLAGVVVTLMMAAPVAAADTVGLVDGETGQWHVFDDEFGRTSFFFGNPGDTPFAGDWDCDGVDTPGLFRASDAFVYLRNSNDQGIADIRFFFGDPGDQPLVGDFDGDGCDTVSIYRAATQQFFVVNALGADDGGLGAADFSFGFGNPGDTPVAGDWDDDGITEIGLYRESTGLFYWRNTLDTGIASDEIFFGNPGDRFVAGDWGLVDGVATPAVYRGANASFFFRYSLTEGPADRTVPTGWSGLVPVSGSFGPLGATTPHLGLSPVGTFVKPLLVAAPEGDARLFVVEQGGVIKVIDGAVTSTFLDVSALTTGSGERGLLGMAFHPTQSKVYVSYTNNDGHSVLAEYVYAGNVADPGTRRVLHPPIEQPYSNHNGGMVAFGPDGFLYWGLGDGGGG